MKDFQWSRALEGKEQWAPCFPPGEFSPPLSPTLVGNSVQENYAEQGEDQGKGIEKLVAQFLVLFKFKAIQEGKRDLRFLHCPAQLTWVRLTMDLRQKAVTMNKDCVYLTYFLCQINPGNFQVQQQATDKSLGTVLWRESRHLRNKATWWNHSLCDKTLTLSFVVPTHYFCLFQI